jgi:nitroreductase
MGDTSEAFARLVESRHSVRSFLPQPVQRDVLEQLLQLAQRAPSNCNSQPWIVHVVSGESLVNLGRALTEAAGTDVPVTPDYPVTTDYTGAYRTRQVGSAKAVFATLGIVRGDVESRRRFYLQNFSFFGAPHVAFVFMQAGFGVREAADCGMFAQNLMLGLASRGIGSCPQGSVSHYAAVVRRELGVHAGHKLLFAISFGYEDTTQPINRMQVGRAALGEDFTFHG